MRLLAQLLEQRRVVLDLSKDQVRLKAGIGPKQVTAVFRGEWESLNWDTISKTMRALGLDEAALAAGLAGRDDLTPLTAICTEVRDELLAKPWLKANQAIIRALQQPLQMPVKRVRVYGNVAAGHGEEQVGVTVNPRDTTPVQAYVLWWGGRVLGLRVKGDSMEPIYRQHDTVIVWYGSHDAMRKVLRPGMPVVVTTQDYVDYLKLAYWDDFGESVTLRSINPDYPPLIFAHEQIRYTGIVVGHWAANYLGIQDTAPVRKRGGLVYDDVAATGDNPDRRQAFELTPGETGGEQ